MGKGASGAVRVDDANGGSTLTYGRQFSADSGSLYSSITRETLNALKAHYWGQVCCPSFFVFAMLCSSVFLHQNDHLLVLSGYALSQM